MTRRQLILASCGMILGMILIVVAVLGTAMYMFDHRVTTARPVSSLQEMMPPDGSGYGSRAA